MRAIRQDIETAVVFYRMVSRDPVVSLPRQQAGHSDQRRRNCKPRRRQRSDQIEKRVHCPDIRDTTVHIK